MEESFRRALQTDPLAQLIASGDEKEQTFQTFFEKNPDYLLVTGLLQNHGLHFGAVISQFPIDTGLICDFAFLTKSSVEWRLVLIEIERPYKKIFTKARVPQPAEYMTKGLSQIASWQSHLETGLAQVTQRLRPFLRPLGGNPVKVWYVLVAGRDFQDLDDSGKAWVRTQNRSNFKLYSYMTLARSYVSDRPYERANTLRLDGQAYRFLNIAYPPMTQLHYCNSNELLLSPSDRMKLLAYKIDAEAWQRGEPWFFDSEKDEWTHPFGA